MSNLSQGIIWLLFAGCFAAWGIVVWRGTREIPAHRCQHCGYDPGESGAEQCPECARPVPTTRDYESATRTGRSIN